MKKSVKSLEYYERARKRIPGISQLLSKKPDMFAPGVWPGYFSKARGAETWDMDGNRFVDMSISGIGACVLGFCDPDVDRAVKGALDTGTMCSFNPPEEVELAELLCELHPWAEKVRYGRSGGEAMAIAVRIVRAHQRKDKIAFCGYHGWHDWYLAANLADEAHLDGHLLPGLSPLGVPRGLTGTAIPFSYNNLQELEGILRKNRGEVAAIVMEPLRDSEPAPGYLEGVKTLAKEHGCLLVFDEITAGFRLTTGGAHLRFGVEPDVAVFAKAISNGFPMAAIIGRGDVLSAAEDSFISSTYWTDRIGPVAALATIQKHRACNVADHLQKMGRLVQEGWKKAAAEASTAIHVSGIYPLSHFHFEGPMAMEKITFFVQRMLEEGFLASGRFYATYAHTEKHVQEYLVAVRKVFGEIVQLEKAGQLAGALKGPVAQSGFKRLT
ncbi:MAG TPA: aminotransferase class III-fold pyridoxal phosphate-dependent enzyme [Kiritimatiellia bacterium]|nr:aminotransferase class III-fold pyridoxal phosphate-dependent enzyme [Kiritimatiellia bacterium]